MKECTLQEAVELCEKNGGRFAARNLINFIDMWWEVSQLGEIKNCKDGDRFLLGSDAFKTTWIYEPPKKSAFQEWNDKINSPAVNPKWVNDLRKEGYNFALETVQKLGFIKRNKFLYDEIEKLKEP